jgi:pimeloyl-ACP methyl ester carboxylesterase
MAFIDRGDASVFYQGAGQGPAVLLTHGFAATSAMWAGQVAALSGDHRVLVWDIRGHGASQADPDPAAYTEGASIADMAAVLDADGVDRAVVGGLSLGGYLSLAFRLDHPDRVAGLILADTGPGFRRSEPRQQWNEDAQRTADSIERNGADRRAAAMGVDASAHRSTDGLVRAARGILPQDDSRVIESLPSIDVPTLVLVGEGDTPFLGSADYLAAKIPGATKVVIPGAGHAANIDRPEAFNAAVGDFLARAGW